MIEPEAHVQVCRALDDDKFIDCAMASHSIYIVSGDKDLLSIEKYRDIEIVTVADFFKRLTKA